MNRAAYLALGANLGDRARALREAIARVAAVEGMNLRAVSRVYETDPVGPGDQPPYLNVVIAVALEDSLPAQDLLRALQQIERELGRQPRPRWHPREIDIDILWVEGERVCTPDLELPHPRLWERAFVLVPLADIAPAFRDAGGRTAAAAASQLDGHHGVRLYACTP